MRSVAFRTYTVFATPRVSSSLRTCSWSHACPDGPYRSVVSLSPDRLGRHWASQKCLAGVFRALAVGFPFFVGVASLSLLGRHHVPRLGTRLSRERSTASAVRPTRVPKTPRMRVRRAQRRRGLQARGRFELPVWRQTGLKECHGVKFQKLAERGMRAVAPVGVFWSTGTQEGAHQCGESDQSAQGCSFYDRP